MRLVLVLFTRCMSSIIETLHDQYFLKRASETPNHQLLGSYPRTKRQEPVYETCACVIHTNLLGYMCNSTCGVHVLREALVITKFKTLQTKIVKYMTIADHTIRWDTRMTIR